MLHPDEPTILPGDLFYRYREATPAIRALAAILAREGAELSATETLRAALEDVDSLARLVPEYDYGYDVHRGPHADEQAEQWIRDAFPDLDDEVDAADVLADDAWPALRAVLHRFADSGTDPVSLLRDRAGERAFASDPDDPARSAAQVLHYRLARDVPYPNQGDHRPDLLPGWVTSPPAPDSDNVDPDHAELADWLRHRATRIVERVHTLGTRTADTKPSWASDLGDVPNDPILRELWIHGAGQVAAYRERWHVADDLDVMLPSCGRGEQGRARQWVVEYLRRNPLPSPVVGEAALGSRTTRIRSRLDLLRTRMASTPPSSAEARPTPDQEVATEHGPGTVPDIDIGP